jgi:hypothetical protein
VQQNYVLFVGVGCKFDGAVCRRLWIQDVQTVQNSVDNFANVGNRVAGYGSGYGDTYTG